MTQKKRIVIGISGASGSCLGVCILNALRDLPEWESHLVVSRAAVKTIITINSRRVSKWTIT